MIEAEEQAFIKQLVAHAAVETLDIAILHRSSRRNVVPLDLVILRPGKNGIRGEFSPIVGDDHAGLAAPFDQRRQFSGDTATGDGRVRDRGEAFACDIVHDIEHVFASSRERAQIVSTEQKWRRLTNGSKRQARGGQISDGEIQRRNYAIAAVCIRHSHSNILSALRI